MCARKWNGRILTAVPIVIISLHSRPHGVSIMWLGLLSIPTCFIFFSEYLLVWTLMSFGSKTLYREWRKFPFVLLEFFKLISLMGPSLNPFSLPGEYVYLLSRYLSGFPKARGPVNVVLRPRNAWSWDLERNVEVTHLSVWLSVHLPKPLHWSLFLPSKLATYGTYNKVVTLEFFVYLRHFFMRFWRGLLIICWAPVTCASSFNCHIYIKKWGSYLYLCRLEKIELTG